MTNDVCAVAYNVASWLGSQHVTFDYQDVLEVGVDGVLQQCGLHLDLTDEARESLRPLLLRLGEARQTAEMARPVERLFERLVVPFEKHRVEPATKEWLAGEAALRKAAMAALRRDRASR